MKRILLCTLTAFSALLLPACESDEITTTTTTTEETTVAHPAGTTTETTRTVAY